MYAYNVKNLKWILTSLRLDSWTDVFAFYPQSFDKPTNIDEFFCRLQKFGSPSTTFGYPNRLSLPAIDTTRDPS